MSQALKNESRIPLTLESVSKDGVKMKVAKSHHFFQFSEGISVRYWRSRWFGAKDQRRGYPQHSDVDRVDGYTKIKPGREGITRMLGCVNEVLQFSGPRRT